MAKFFTQIKILVIILIIICVFSIVPFWISEVLDSQYTKKLGMQSNIFSIPKAPIIKPLKTFTFPSPREGEEHQFVVKITDKEFLLKISLQLAYDKDNYELAGELQARIYQLQDAIQYFIALKNFKDINTVDKQHNFLKKELIGIVNALLTRGKIQDIYFTQFYIIPQ